MNLKIKLSKLPKEIIRLIKEVSSLSGRLNVKAYLAGGIVRDIILSRDNFDLDIAVESDAIDFALKLSQKLGAGLKKYRSFGTASVLSEPYKIDLATARKEYYPYPGSLPEVKPASIEEDLKRRDFTINALALSLNKESFGEVLDYFGGVNDLKKKVIRILKNDSFLEDPTRIIRAVRFKERFSFKFSSLTEKALKKAVSLNAFDSVNPHRLRDEVILILKEDNPSKQLSSLNKTAGLKFLGVKPFNREDLRVLKSIDKAVIWSRKNFPLKKDVDIWLVYLMAAFRNTNINRLKSIIDRFGFRRGERIKILNSKKIGIISSLSKENLPSKIYRLLNPLSFETILFFYALSINGFTRRNIRKFLKEYSKKKLLIRGKDLQERGIKPENRYGSIMKKVFFKKLDGKISTKEGEIKELEKYM